MRFNKYFLVERGTMLDRSLAVFAQHCDVVVVKFEEVY